MQSRGTSRTGVFDIGNGKAFYSHAFESDLAANGHLSCFAPSGVGKPERLNIFLIEASIFETTCRGSDCQILDAFILMLAELDGINSDDIDVPHRIPLV